MMILLNLVHIMAGAFWAGAVLLLTFFLFPAMESAGPQGGAVMQKLVKGTRFPLAMMGSGVLTILSGLALYWFVSGGLSAAWISSSHGVAITVGGIGGILAAIVGGAMSGRASKRLGALMQEIQAAGAQPTADQQMEIASLKRTVRRGSLAGAAFILVALVGMSVARAL
ncbi:MAG TPA: hypothetical protein VF651_00815 [Gammaproteobacteria bacterium]